MLPTHTTCTTSLSSFCKNEVCRYFLNIWSSSTYSSGYSQTRWRWNIWIQSWTAKISAAGVGFISELVFSKPKTQNNCAARFLWPHTHLRFPGIGDMSIFISHLSQWDHFGYGQRPVAKNLCVHTYGKFSLRNISLSCTFFSLTFLEKPWAMHNFAWMVMCG